MTEQLSALTCDNVLGCTVAAMDGFYHPGVRWNNDEPITSEMLLTAFEAGKVRGQWESQRAGMKAYDKLTFWNRVRVLRDFLIKRTRDNIAERRRNFRMNKSKLFRN